MLAEANICHCKSLHDAARAGHDDCVKALIPTPIRNNLERKDESNYTPLMWAAAGLHMDCIKSLLGAGALPNGTPHVLVDDDTTYYADINCPLVLVADRIDCPGNRDECVELLNSAGGCPHSALVVALYIEARNAVEYLIRRTSADITKALHLATHQEKVDTIRELIQLGGNVNAQDVFVDGDPYYPWVYHAVLHVAVGIRHGPRKIQIVKDLLRMGAYVNQIDIVGDNPIKTHLRDFFGFHEPFCDKTFMLLHAAGDRIEGIIYYFSDDNVNPLDKMRDYAKSRNDVNTRKMQECIKQLENNSLRELTREAIRTYLFGIDKHTNLFVRIPRLGLPQQLCRFMLFEMSVHPIDV